MNDMNDYLWLVKTNKGDFFITVIGNWTQEEAAKKLRLVFDGIKLDIIGMIPRKRATGPDDAMCTLYQKEEPKDDPGFQFLAGKKLWDVCGRGAEYEAEQIRYRWVRYQVGRRYYLSPTLVTSFAELANRWHDETDHLSSPSSITESDTYLKIISMGEVVIPLILQDLQERGGNWYRALRILSDADPVPAEVRGEVPKMKEAWLSWGLDKGYIKASV